MDFLAVTSGLTSWFLNASGWDCDQAPGDIVHHAESLLPPVLLMVLIGQQGHKT